MLFSSNLRSKSLRKRGCGRHPERNLTKFVLRLFEGGFFRFNTNPWSFQLILLLRSISWFKWWWPWLPVEKQDRSSKLEFGVMVFTNSSRLPKKSANVTLLPVEPLLESLFFATWLLPLHNALSDVWCLRQLASMLDHSFSTQGSYSALLTNGLLELHWETRTIVPDYCSNSSSKNNKFGRWSICLMKIKVGKGQNSFT